ncbi:uncharacterized protein LOC114361858 [Ostrinia furnacalis]|uniref:uncharacterized protein LOC114361858 n=1 Tax=Ostrinia furnacalis TaxID=93504 RepID=UPI00103F1672|nr:uncharacterized protein LOC114361858 [Ostrinia furnacalis]
MSSNEENLPSTSGQGQGRGRGRGRGRGANRGRGAEDPEALLTVRAARQVSQRHFANLSAADKDDLPDAPPRKRRTLNASPERELPEVVDPLQPTPQVDPLQPSTSWQPTPPLQVPADVEFVHNEEKRFPFIKS